MVTETPTYSSESTDNEWKRVKIRIGGGTAAKSIWEVFSGKTDKLPNGLGYFAPNLDNYLFLDNDTGVSFKVSAKYVPVLEQMMKKFKDSTIGKAAGLIQKLSDATAGLDMAKLGKSIAAGTTTGKAVLSNLRVLPANVRYQTKFQNLPAWDSTGPIELGSFTFRFYLGMAGVYDGRTEVYNPALAMSKINQPSEISTGVLQGPLPNTAWVYGVIGSSVAQGVAYATTSLADAPLKRTAQAAAPFSEPAPTRGMYQGSAIDDQARYDKDYKAWLAKKAAYEAEVAKADVTVPVDAAGHYTSQVEQTLNSYMAGYEKALSRALDTWPGIGLVQISIGQFTLPKMTVETTDVKFSYDTDDKGYPIWAEVTWSGCKTLEVATIQQMPLRTADADGGAEAYLSTAAAAFPAETRVSGAGTAGLETDSAKGVDVVIRK